MLNSFSLHLFSFCHFSFSTSFLSSTTSSSIFFRFAHLDHSAYSAAVTDCDHRNTFHTRIRTCDASSRPNSPPEPNGSTGSTKPTHNGDKYLLDLGQTQLPRVQQNQVAITESQVLRYNNRHRVAERRNQRYDHLDPHDETVYAESPISLCSLQGDTPQPHDERDESYVQHREHLHSPSVEHVDQRAAQLQHQHPTKWLPSSANSRTVRCDCYYSSWN